MSASSPEKVKSRPTEIQGYAIISDDNKIAGADGLIPASLRNQKDWDYYQRALAASDLIVFGRRSHELEPNVRGDLRLVVSRGADGLEQRADGWWWNPARVGWAEVVKRVLPAWRRRGGAGRARRVRSIPGDWLRRVSFVARAWREAPRRAVGLFRLRRGPLSRGRARQSGSPPQRENCARPGAWRRNDRLANRPRGRRPICGRPSVLNRRIPKPPARTRFYWGPPQPSRYSVMSSTIAGAAARSENRTQSGSNARNIV